MATPVVTTCANDAIAAPTNRQASGGEQDCSSDARTSALSSVHEYPHSNLRKKRTKNGIPWLDVHRGLIIAAQDRGRPYRGVPPDPGDTDTFELDDAVYLNKNRCWVVDRRFPDHVQALPIYTHTGGGLKALSKDLQFESMCIRPFSGVANWTNEVPWNEVLEIKTRHSGIILSASASVRVSQSILIDRWEDYEIIAELDDASMDKIKAKQEQLDKLAG